MLNASGLSDPGPVRKNNQDSFATDDELRVFVVADGMGGHSAGEVASSLAVEAIVAFIRRSHEDADISWPYGIEPELSFDGNRLRTAIHLANRRVFRAAERYDEYTGMGTTVVAALVSDHRVSVGHAGDSRAYLLSDGAFRRLTVDDTWAATVLADTPSDPTPQAMRHVLTNAIGVREDVSVHLTEFELRAGQVILLCSDGVHNVVDDNTLRDLMALDAPASTIAARIIELALANGARDNVTALVVRNDRD